MNILLEGDSGGSTLPSGIISNVSNSNNNKKESIKDGNAAPTGKTPANKSEKAANLNEKEKRPKTDQKPKDPPKKSENQPNKVLIAASPVPQKKIVFQQPSNVPNQKNIKEKPKELQKEKKEEVSTPKSK